MKVIKKGVPNTVICDCCKSELQFTCDDLMWSHTEENYYYIFCPVCKEKIWLKSTPKLDILYAQKNKK